MSSIVLQLTGGSWTSQVANLQRIPDRYGHESLPVLLSLFVQFIFRLYFQAILRKKKAKAAFFWFLLSMIIDAT
jgi:hypothetical protein